MSFVTGSVRQVFYEGSGGYKIGLFKIKETDDEDLKKGQIVTFTGSFSDLVYDGNYTLYGNYIYKDKYGYEYKVDRYEKVEPVGRDAVIDFLSSNLIKSCGPTTAKKIVDYLGDDALAKIKENPNSLINIKGITAKSALAIYESVIAYSSSDELIIEIQNLGFSVKEALLIVEKFGNDSVEYLKNNVYQFKDLIDFDKLDQVYLEHYGDILDDVRVKACILKSFDLISFQEGSIFFSFDELLNFVSKKYLKGIDEVLFDNGLNSLVELGFVVKEDSHYYLNEHFEDEEVIVDCVDRILNNTSKRVTGVKDCIEYLEDMNDFRYNEEQHLAIESALKNRLSIITGGPGTGKTTIINAIVSIYIKINDLSNKDVINDIALLAPTGRAARKLSDVTGLGAMTIHRYLKWNKDSNEFNVNELNKNNHKLIIVDEVSMIDMFLFKALLSGLNSKITLVLVGDVNQLPSVGAGNVLGDLIDSEKVPYTALSYIYRQTLNSYIPVLAEEIRNKELGDFTTQKDDYNFLNVNSSRLIDTIKEIVKRSLDRGIDENKLQILAPIYRGMCGIDNLNTVLRDIYNPYDKKKNEVSHYGVVFREGDKILQLVNDPDINVFNGDIGFIKSIKTEYNKAVIIIDFDGNKVEASKEDLANIKHAYAITIHKAQGSEFENVIMPVVSHYGIMLYNKLIYTGVSRAKKSLVVLGEVDVFRSSVSNNYSQNRKTSLKSKLMNKI